MGIVPGQIIGDYEVLGQIGAGGMGNVYKVRNLISERIDAMKVLRPDAESTPDAAGRFLREIKLQASLKHPNIAVLYTAMRFEDQILMFMEMVEGIGLDERLRRGWLGPRESIQYVSQCLMALEYAHQRGVVHRDIKLSNLMLTAAGVKLLDFGIARGAKDLALTCAGTVVGSVHYMSPEQALGEEVDARSDLYSTGVMLYEMLVGARPFAGDNAYSILKAHIEQEPLSPADLNPALPKSLCDAVLKAMHKRREERFQTAAAFCAAIQETATSDIRSLAGDAAARPLAEAGLGAEWRETESDDENSGWIRFLTSTELFQAVPAAALQQLAGEFEWTHLDAGEILMRRGDPGDCLYVIFSGILHVIDSTPGFEDLIHVELGPGELVGEIALWTREPRSATVRVVKAARVARLARERFDRIAAAHPEAAQAVDRIVARRLRKNQLSSALRGAKLFGKLDEEALRELEAELELLWIEGGKTLFRQGDPGDALYLILSGKLRVWVEHSGREPHLAAELGRGTTVGEMAVIDGEPRSATVIAARDSQLGRLSKAGFERRAAARQAILAIVARQFVGRLRDHSSA